MLSDETLAEPRVAAGSEARLTGACPIVPVRRVDRTVAFYTDVLGFDLLDRNAGGTFAYVGRGGAGVMLLDLHDAKALQATGAFMSAYLWVEDVVAYYDEIRPALSRLPENRVQPLFEKADGRHEFHVRDPDGFLLFFGEARAR